MAEKTSLDTMRTDHTLGAPIYVISLSKAVVLRMAAYSVPLFFLAAGVFSTLTGREASIESSALIGISVLYLAAFVVMIVAHELVHGLFFRIFGGNPRYGAGVKYFFPYFYATSPGDAFPLGQMMIISLAPLFILSTLSLLGALLFPALTGYLTVVFIGNTAGAIGDIWMTSRLVRFLPFKDATVIGLRDGVAVYSQDAKAEEIASALYVRDERPPVFVMQWLRGALVMFATEILAVFIGPLFTDELFIGPPQFPLITFTISDQSPEATFSLGLPILAGLVFALAAHLFSRREPREMESQATQ